MDVHPFAFMYILPDIYISGPDAILKMEGAPYIFSRGALLRFLDERDFRR